MINSKKKNTTKNEKLFEELFFNEPKILNTISEVFNNQKIGCEIKDFLTHEECDNLVEMVEKYEMDHSYLSGNANKILESQHNRQKEPDLYFAGANNHPLLQDSSFNKVKMKLIKLLTFASDTNVDVAYEPNRKQFYNPAIIREFHSSLKLHNDLGSREGKDWNPIQKVNSQWAFVIKLTKCVGGSTFVYDRKWKLEDEIFFNKSDNYSYDMKVIEGCDEYKVKGLKGSLILFDCTNYHRVEKVRLGRRYSMGGFIGFLEEEKQFILWS